MIPVNFLNNIRVMIHTLTDHMATFFPDPWERAISDEEETTSAETELLSLAHDLQQVWLHTQKLARQVDRSYELLRVGKYNKPVYLLFALPANYQLEIF